MNIGIIGGGITGLVLAQRLSHQGHTVTVFDSNKQLGGLTTYHDYGLFTWDRFYHVILPSDTHLINFLRDIGLGDKLRWHRSLTGFYDNQKFYSISNSIEFLRFPLFGLIGKIRLAFTLLYGSRLNNWRRLEKILVEDWLLKLGGKSTSLNKEQLGYVSGGYKTVFDHIEKLIYAAGGHIHTGVAVEYISPNPGGGMWVEYQGKKEHFDKVIFTGPVNILQQVAANELVKVSDSGETVEYLGVICMVLITRKALVPYYVVNIADRNIPFTGVIGMSNLVSLQETAGYHITFLPKYILSTDPLLKQPDDELRQVFFQGIRLMFPELKADDIVAAHINRAIKVQPLQVLNYSSLVPKVSTENDDFFVVNTSQLVNDSVNNNAVVRQVDEFLKKSTLLNS